MENNKEKSPHHKNLERIKQLENITHKISGNLNSYKSSAFQKFPFLFVFLSTFGLVATLYGFEKLIDQIPFFADRPHILLGTGIVVLLITGTLYKKLD